MNLCHSLISAPYSSLSFLKCVCVGVLTCLKVCCFPLQIAYLDKYEIHGQSEICDEICDSCP